MEEKRNLNDWSVEEAYNWVKNEVGNIIPKDLFLAHEISGRDLVDLTEDNLKYDLKINKLHDRKLFLRKICDLIKVINDNPINNVVKNVVNNNDNTIIVRFHNSNLKFKTSNLLKVKDILNDSFNILNIPKETAGYLTDSEGSILPNESLINDLITSKNSVITLNTNINISNTLSKKKAEDKDEKENKESRENRENKTTRDTNNYKKAIKNANYNTIQESIIRDNSLAETALKHRYLSFEALDNFEKNGFSFSIKKNLNKKFDKEKENENEKVTINSFYNISNLNTYNNETNPEIHKSNKKRNKLSCLNIRSKKQPELEEENPVRFNMHSKNSKELKQSISDESENQFYKKDNFVDKLCNYYNDAKKIKSILNIKFFQVNNTKKNLLNLFPNSSSVNSPAMCGVRNENEKLYDNEHEIHNFLKSMKSK